MKTYVIARTVWVLINPTEKKPEYTKTINNVRNNSEKPHTGAKANKDSVIIVGDSMIKHVNGRNISRSQRVKFRPNPGASTHDLLDYVKPIMRKGRKPW